MAKRLILSVCITLIILSAVLISVQAGDDKGERLNQYHPNNGHSSVYHHSGDQDDRKAGASETSGANSSGATKQENEDKKEPEPILGHHHIEQWMFPPELMPYAVAASNADQVTIAPPNGYTGAPIAVPMASNGVPIGPAFTGNYNTVPMFNPMFGNGQVFPPMGGPYGGPYGGVATNVIPNQAFPVQQAYGAQQAYRTQQAFPNQVPMMPNQGSFPQSADNNNLFNQAVKDALAPNAQNQSSSSNSNNNGVDSEESKKLQEDWNRFRKGLRRTARVYGGVRAAASVGRVLGRIIWLSTAPRPVL